MSCGLPVICADGLTDAALAGVECAVPNCRRTFLRPWWWMTGPVGHPGDLERARYKGSRVVAVTVRGRPVRVCADHRDEDVLEPVA
jgi:hypothetical protein